MKIVNLPDKSDCLGSVSIKSGATKTRQFINGDAVIARAPCQFDTFDLVVIRPTFNGGRCSPVIDCLSRKPGFRFGSGSIMRDVLRVRHTSVCKSP